MTLEEKYIQLLVEQADKSRQNARVPMTNFRVGAALITKNGKIFSGCNVELANFLYSICAERTALVKMISEGDDLPEAIAVIADTINPIAPCGQCRSMLYDFNPDLLIIMATTRSSEVLIKTIGELLPFSYKRSDR